MSQQPTTEVLIALQHVREYVPSISTIIVRRDGSWLFLNEDGNAPSLQHGDIETDILQAAADSIKDTPYIYEWTQEVAIPQLVILTKQDVENLIVGAIEGGSNYWYHLDDVQYIKDATPEMDGEPLSMRIVDYVLNKSGEVKVYDAEQWSDKDPGELLGVLSAKTIMQAEQLMFKDHRSCLSSILSEDYDSSTSDSFFQLAIMKDIVYG